MTPWSQPGRAKAPLSSPRPGRDSPTNSTHTNNLGTSTGPTTEADAAVSTSNGYPVPEGTNDNGGRDVMDKVKMLVNGQAMSGGTLNHALEGARLIGAVETAPLYRFYCVRDEFPGLFPVAENRVSVPGELYEVDYSVLGEQLLPHEPAELELTVVQLSDGTGGLCMKMRTEALDTPGVTDISACGGWLVYLASKTT